MSDVGADLAGSGHGNNPDAAVRRRKMTVQLREARRSLSEPDAIPSHSAAMVRLFAEINRSASPMLGVIALGVCATALAWVDAGPLVTWITFIACDVGIGTGAPFGTEPAGDFAEDHAGPQGTLAVVVGGGNIAAGDEDKEIAAAFADAAGELAAGLGGGVDGEQPVEPAVEVGAVLGEGGVLQLRAPLADGDGAAQQLLKARRETGIAGIDGVLGIAQQMGKAQLAFVSMLGLRRIAVGNPDIGLGFAEEIGQHCAATIGDQMVDSGGREQHPLPPIFSLDPGRGLVRGHYFAAANFCGGGRGLH